MHAGVRAIACGELSSMVLKQDGTVMSTGHNKFGQLGDGTNTWQGYRQGSTFETVLCPGNSYLQDSVCKTCPADATCDGTKATCTTSTNYLDGNNVCKACPSGSTCDGRTATECDRTKHVVDNVCKTCPADATCDGTKATCTATAHFVDGNNVCKPLSKDVTAIARGYKNFFALKKDGSVWSTGWNKYGTLGDGTFIDRNTFVQALPPGSGQWDTMMWTTRMLSYSDPCKPSALPCTCICGMYLLAFTP